MSPQKSYLYGSSPRRKSNDLQPGLRRMAQRALNADQANAIRREIGRPSVLVEERVLLVAEHVHDRDRLAAHGNEAEVSVADRETTEELTVEAHPELGVERALPGPEGFPALSVQIEENVEKLGVPVQIDVCHLDAGKVPLQLSLAPADRISRAGRKPLHVFLIGRTKHGARALEAKVDRHFTRCGGLARRVAEQMRVRANRVELDQVIIDRRALARNCSTLRQQRSS